MSGEVSFDVVSEFDAQELRNALDQVRRETLQRYDFRGATVDLEQGKDELVLVTDDEFPKVKSQIQGDAVRVSGKSKDDLQRVITRLRGLDEIVELQFQNYR